MSSRAMISVSSLHFVAKQLCTNYDLYDIMSHQVLFFPDLRDIP